MGYDGAFTKEHKLGRVCDRCGKPIWDSHKTGICPECWGLIAKEQSYNKKYGGESEAHKALKLIAYRFLSDLNCVSRSEEKRLRVDGNRVRVDMLGKTRDGKLIAVECGGSQVKKLKKLRGMVEAIYILPYNSTIPYLWSEDIKICFNCGHIISRCKK